VRASRMVERCSMGAYIRPISILQGAKKKGPANVLAGASQCSRYAAGPPKALFQADTTWRFRFNLPGFHAECPSFVRS
jgi:hypothetical protein